jgi:hypothetical protein
MREEPRQRDWWLVGCATLAAVLIAVDVAAVLSDHVVAGSAGAPQVQSTTLSAFGDGPVQVPASEAPGSLRGTPRAEMVSAK